MTKFKKLLVASLAAITLVFSASICALGAQIDSLSVVDNTIYAQVDAENARLYVAEYNEGVLDDVFFTSIGEDGSVELPIGEASEYQLYLWDKESLAPISATYTLKDGRAYTEGSQVAVPEYEFSAYSFNQDDNVMVVSAITDTTITGFKAGIETTYALTGDVVVLGLSDSLSDVVPGSVVLIGTNRAGNCAAIELLASLGIPVNQEVFESSFGVYDASDGSTKYKNVVTEMYSKDGTQLTTQNFPDTVQTVYQFVANAPCYRIGIAMEGDTPIITCIGKKISTFPSIFENTAKYHNYLYLRYDSETEKVKECVFYCVPKDFNFNDPDYSPIFSLKPIVIIE